MTLILGKSHIRVYASLYVVSSTNMVRYHWAELLLKLTVCECYGALQIRVDVVMRLASVVSAVVFLYKFGCISYNLKIHAQWFALNIVSKP